MMMRRGNKKTVMKCCDVQECGNIAAKKRAANPGKTVRPHLCHAWECVAMRANIWLGPILPLLQKLARV